MKKVANRTRNSTVLSSRWRQWILPLLSVLLVSSSSVLLEAVSSAASASTSGGFGPLPAGLPIESRCQDMTINTHIVFVGQYVDAQTHGGICGVTGKDNSWNWAAIPGNGNKGCKHDGTYCEFKVTQSTFPELESLCIYGANVQGAWTSCDYFGVVGDNMGILDGHVTDKDGGPVAGTTIKAYGHPGATTTSDADGFYAMELEKGTYQVEPSGGPQGKASPSYSPKVTRADVVAKKTSHVDFTLDTSIELKLHFAKTTVVANGYEVVSGTITTTQYGKPLPDVNVQLEVQPTQSAVQSVTAGARASVCVNGSRVWPTNSLNDPDGYPVTVSTGATGTYDFSVTVGTTPGKWTLDAWAFNSSGTLSSDVTAASDTKSVDFTTNGSSSLGGFVTELDTAARSTTFSTSLISDANSANSMWSLLSQVTKTGAGGINFGGLDYSLVNAKDGQSLIIFPEGKPPVLNKAGEMMSGRPGNSGDLVYDPAEWTGAGLASSVTNAASLTSVVSRGLLTRLPTLAEFDAGQSVPGWKTVKGDEITQFSANYEFLGWGYPTSTPGSCY